MSKKFVIVFAMAVVLALSACGPSEADIQAAIQKTQAAIPTSTPIPTETPVPPTPTATPVPLADIDIESLVIQDGDLPAGMSGGQIFGEAPKVLAGAPEPATIIRQELADGSDTVGSVTIGLYETSAYVERTYKILLGGLGDEEAVDGLGDEAAASSFSASVAGTDVESVALAFYRCSAVVYIVFSNTSDADVAIAYAKRLDKRLAETVCR